MTKKEMKAFLKACGFAIPTDAYLDKLYGKQPEPKGVNHEASNE